MEKINAYPLIYTRTRCCDFLTERNGYFIVKPELNENDFTEIKSKISESMSSIDLKNCGKIRYIAFTTGNLLIYGISCITTNLAEECGIDLNSPCKKNKEKTYSYYLKDEAERKIKCFIGLAFDLKEIKNIKGIPDIYNLQFFLNIFLNYTFPQWERKVVSSSVIDIPEKVDVKSFSDIMSEISPTKHNEKYYMIDKGNNKLNIIENMLKGVIENNYSAIYKMINSKERLNIQSFSHIAIDENIFNDITSGESVSDTQDDEFTAEQNNTLIGNNSVNISNVSTDNNGFGGTLCGGTASTSSNTGKNNNSNSEYETLAKLANKPIPNKNEEKKHNRNRKVRNPIPSSFCCFPLLL